MKQILIRSVSVLHLNEGGIGKSIPDAKDMPRLDGSKETSMAEGVDLPNFPSFGGVRTFCSSL